MGWLGGFRMKPAKPCDECSHTARHDLAVDAVELACLSEWQGAEKIRRNRPVVFVVRPNDEPHTLAGEIACCILLFECQCVRHVLRPSFASICEVISHNRIWRKAYVNKNLKNVALNSRLSVDAERPRAISRARPRLERKGLATFQRMILLSHSYDEAKPRRSHVRSLSREGRPSGVTVASDYIPPAVTFGCRGMVAA